jgi:hypothetical protein
MREKAASLSTEAGSSIVDSRREIVRVIRCHKVIVGRLSVRQWKLKVAPLRTCRSSITALPGAASPRLRAASLAPHLAMAKLTDQQRRALQLPANSPSGCAEAMMLARGFELEMLGQFVLNGLAEAETRTTMAARRAPGSSGCGSLRRSGRRSRSDNLNTARSGRTLSAHETLGKHRTSLCGRENFRRQHA